MTERSDSTSLAEQALRVAAEGAEMMWRNALADIVIELLKRGEPISQDTLRTTIETRICADGISRMDRASLVGVLKALDGKAPS